MYNFILANNNNIQEGGKMLATQVQYWNYKESQRHNAVAEKQQDFIMREGQRHNLIAERQNQESIDESKRHNQAYEAMQKDALRETIRHNKAGESLSWSNFNETVRHNVETESTQKVQAQASKQSAEAATSQASTAFLNFGSQDSLRKAQALQHKASAEKIKKETKYLAQDNVRSWVNTIGGVIKPLTDAVSNATKLTKFFK